MSRFRPYDDAKPFSKRWWLHQIRTLFWVAIITVLIWVYADMEFTDTKTISATLHLTTGSNLILLSQQDIPMTFKVEGNRSSLQRFQRRLSDRGSVIRHQVTQHDTDFSVRDILSQNADILKAGLTVLSATPVTLNVTVDQRAMHDVTVKFQYVGATLAQDPQVKPAKMPIQVGKRQWQQILSRVSANELPVLQTTPVDLKNTPPGGPTTLPNVEVIPTIAGISVQPAQSTVSVTFQVNQRIATKTITVSVRVLLPADDLTWRDYELLRKDPLEWRKTLQVAGPRKDLDQLDEKDVDAYVVLREGDTTPVESWLTRPVQVRFPRGLQIKLVGERPTVSFKLVRRTASAGATGMP